MKWEEIEHIWKGLTMQDDKTRTECLAVIRSQIDRLDRSLRRLWDFFEEEDWRRSSHEVEKLHEGVGIVQSLLADMIKQEALHDQDHGNGVSADTSHRGKPAS